MLFNREPALIMGAIGAAIALAVGFGLKISGEQVTLIMIFASALIALITGVVIRAKVVPTEKANDQIATAIRMPSSATVEDVIAKNEKESK